MSLRGFFSRNTDSHRRRKNALTSAGLSSKAEHLEDRVLLSVDSPTLIDHGVAFTNMNVLDDDIFFYAVNNPLYSDNNASNPDPQHGAGSGLNVVLDGSQVFGNPPITAAIPQINTINYSPTFGPLAFNNNANTGSSLTLRNMTVDTLRIDLASFVGNGRAGLIINLTNVTANNIIIANSQFLNNANDGLCLLGDNVNVDTIQLVNNNFSNNSRTTTSSTNAGALLRFSNSRLGQVSIVGNTFTDNGGHGLRLDLDNTSLSNLELSGNSANANARNGNAAGVFLDLQDSDVGGAITNNAFRDNLFVPNPLNPNLTQGDGLLVQARRSILPDGSVAAGLRNLQLDTVRSNAFTGNGGVGASFDLGQNTTLRSTITSNQFLSNGRTGLNIQAKDTQNAFDVQIGGLTTDSQNNPIDANVIMANRGAGVAISLDDTSSVLGNTTGRFRLFNNIINSNLDDGLNNTEFSGEGLFVRARGSVALTNGAARLLNSRIDGNNIEGNAGHGMLFDISEDSEVIDLLIGDLEDPANPAEGFEGDGFTFENQFVRNSGNIVRNNLGDGLNFLRRDAALAQNVQVIDNLFEGNASGAHYTVRNLDNVVNTVKFAYNDLVNNVLDGLTIETQIDAILVADLDRNLISGNAGDGIFTNGFEGDATDAETLGGVWTRNVIQNNLGKGIALNGVPGGVSTLEIGLLGTDSIGATLGNLIDSNGDDGVEINAPGAVNLVNNQITFNGQNNTTQDVHGDGKGIDINLNDVGLPFTTSGDLSVYLGFNVIQSNFGDGIEVISRDNNFTSTIVQVLAYGNIVDLNLGRGVDVLTAGDTAETYIVFGDGSTGDGSNRNIIRSNGLEAFYVVSTASITQSQSVDALTPLASDGSVLFAPNITLDLDGNEIQDNGLPANGGQLDGSGLVIRVGTGGTDRFGYDTIPDRDGNFGFTFFESDYVGVGTSNSAELGNGRVNARVNNNTFGGNRGVDVITESFTSTVDPVATAGTWNANMYTVTNNQTDPLARFNFEFTNNRGNSVELVRLGAFYNNAEGVYKSRTSQGQTPAGPFGNAGNATRFRNAQRLPDRPDFFDSPTMGSGGLFTGFGTGSAGDITSIFPGAPNTPIRVTTAARGGSVFNASNADPIVISSFNHRLVTGEFVEITGVTGNTAANGVFQVTVIDADTFSLMDPISGATVPGNGNYLGGGSWTVVSQGNIINLSGAATSPIVITDFFHTLTTGDQVTVVGVQGNTAANGTFLVTVIDSTSFFLNGSVANGDWVPGTGTYFTPSSGHGLFDGDMVSLSAFGFGPSTPGFDIEGIYEITVVNANEFFLNGTEGETHVPTTLFFAEFQEVTLFDPFLYPGLGGSTFRIVESNNNFPQGSDFDEDTGEFSIGYANSGVGHLSYTYDREELGTFNFRQISVGDAQAVEGDQIGFVITLSQAMATDLMVDYQTIYSGSASDGVTASAPPTADYVVTTDTAIIPAGSTEVTVFIDTIADTAFEDDETFQLSIIDAFTFVFDNAGGFFVPQTFATPVDGPGVGTILNNDVAPTVSISDAGGFEKGNGEVGTMTFTVSLSNASSTPVFVDFSTQDQTANAGVDYRSSTGTLTFAPGETQKTITIEILPDSVFGVPGNDIDQETLFINLTSVQGAIPADSQGLGTIFESRFVTITDAFANGEGTGTTQAMFTLQLVDANGIPSFVPQGQQITVNFNTANGTAIAGSDYVAVTNGSVVFDQFESQKTLSVTVNQDLVYEGDETFTVNISSPQGTVRPSEALGIGNILEANEVASTRDAGGQGIIQSFNYRTGAPRFTLAPFPGFGGEIRVANADFNQDGIPDIVAAAGPGGGPHVKVLNGGDGSLLFQFFAYDPAMTSGVFVATGDVDADGNMDIITGPDVGGGPNIRVFEFNSIAQTVELTEDSLATQFGTGFTGGLRVAAGDVVLSDPGDEIIVGYGPGSLPRVEVIRADGNILSQIDSQFAFDAYGAFGGGVYVSAADIGTNSINNTPDGIADIITGAGAGGGPHVQVFSGADQSVLESFFAYSSAFTGGVRVASGDVFDAIPTNPSRNRVSEVLTAPGMGGGPHVRAFSVDGVPGTGPAAIGSGVFPFAPNLTSGTFISGRSRGNAGEGSPLRLDPAANPTGEAVPALTPAELQSIVEAAFQRLQAAGISESTLNELRELEFVIADLQDDLIGLHTPGQILIDRTAAGRGYFVDLTPNQDEEFTLQQGRLIANTIAAQGKVDLLSVLLHELGHALGEDHETDPSDSHDLLAPTILPGERRLLEDDVFSANELFESLMDLN